MGEVVHVSESRMERKTGAAARGPSARRDEPVIFSVPGAIARTLQRLNRRN
jgi:hypothetical protein